MDSNVFDVDLNVDDVDSNMSDVDSNGFDVDVVIFGKDIKIYVNNSCFYRWNFSMFPLVLRRDRCQVPKKSAFEEARE